MKNSKLPGTSGTVLLALPIVLSLAFAPAVSAQTYFPPPPASAQAAYSQQDLDQMLAPIALYPDALLSQILMAATYPLEVVQAARWSRGNPGLQGDRAVRAVEQKDWDPSIKSLVAFPQVLAMMDEKLEWTERLGDAFLAQESQAMDSVQYLRQRAYAAGTLQSDDRISVVTQGPVIMIEPANPSFVYVPYYDPTVVYGGWWWPEPPVYWAPWRGYQPPHSGFYFSWGAGIPVVSGFFFGAIDWPRRHMRIVNVNTYYYARTVVINRQMNAHSNTAISNVNTAPGIWRHDPAHRRGAPYQGVAGAHTNFASEGARRVEVRQQALSEIRADSRRHPEVATRVESRQETPPAVHAGFPARQPRLEQHAVQAAPRAPQPRRESAARPARSAPVSQAATAHPAANAQERRPVRRPMLRHGDGGGDSGKKTKGALVPGAR